MSQAILLCSICVLDSLDQKPETLCFAVFVYSIEKAFEIRKLAHSMGETYGNHVDQVGREIIQRLK